MSTSSNLVAAVGDNIRLSEALLLKDRYSVVPNLSSCELSTNEEMEVHVFNLTKTTPCRLTNSKDIAAWLLASNDLSPNVLVNYFVEHLNVFDPYCTMICGANSSDTDFSNAVLSFIRKIRLVKAITRQTTLKTLTIRFGLKLFETHSRTKRFVAGGVTNTRSTDVSIMTLLKSILDKQLFAELLYYLISTESSKLEQIRAIMSDDHGHDRDISEGDENAPSQHLSEFLLLYKSGGQQVEKTAMTADLNDMNIVIDLYHMVTNIQQTYYQHEAELQMDSNVIVGQRKQMRKPVLFADDCPFARCWKVELLASNESREHFFVILNPNCIVLLRQHSATDSGKGFAVTRGTYYMHIAIPLTTEMIVTYNVDSFELTYTGATGVVLGVSQCHLPQADAGIPLIHFHPHSKKITEIKYSSHMVFQYTSQKTPLLKPGGSKASNALNAIPFCCEPLARHSSQQAYQNSGTSINVELNEDNRSAGQVVQDWCDEIEESVQLRLREGSPYVAGAENLAQAPAHSLHTLGASGAGPTEIKSSLKVSSPDESFQGLSHHGSGNLENTESINTTRPKSSSGARVKFTEQDSDLL